MRFSRPTVNRIQAIIILVIVITAASGAYWYYLSTIAKPKVGGSLALYTSLAAPDADAVVKEFGVAYPNIKLDVFRSGSTEVVAKILAESKAGAVRADLIWIADASAYYAMMQTGVKFMKYNSPGAKGIPAGLMDPDGNWVAAAALGVVLIYNTNLVKDKPTSWNDLAKYGNKAAMPNPFYSGAAVLVVGGLAKELGWDYFRTLKNAGVGVLQSNPNVISAVAAGEYQIGMAAHDVTVTTIRKGAPLAIAYPKEGNFLVAYALAIAGDTKNPDAAKSFVDYFLSDNGQKFVVSRGLLPARSGIEGPPEILPMAQMNVFPLDYNWIAGHRDEIMSNFDTIMLH